MSNEIPGDPYRIIARERSHDEAKESVATNRMLVQSLILINGGAAVSALAFYGAHDLGLFFPFLRSMSAAKAIHLNSGPRLDHRYRPGPVHPL
jgi:hypothetical protein